MKTLAKRSLAIFLAVFMLFSTMSVCFTTAYASAEYYENDVVYLQTNSQWRQLVETGTDSDGNSVYGTARFAAYLYNETEKTSAWVSAEAIEDDTITYSVAVPEGNWTNIIFCRMNPAYTENAWNGDEVTDRVWNQTDDLTLSNDYDCFDITDWSTGEWSNYHDKFLYFVNTKGWEQVASYCKAITGYGGDTWPGKLCKLVDEELNVYACKPGSYPKVIFNNYQYTGENTSTFDFREVAGKYIEPKTNAAYDTAEEAWEAANNYVETTEPTSESTDPTEEVIDFSISRIYFDNSFTQWENVYLYGWSNGLGDTYAMAQIEDTDFWYFDLPQPVKAGVECFLFKDTKDGWENIHYSENVTIASGYDCYRPEGNKYNDAGQLISSYSWTVYTGEAPELPTNSTETVDPGVPMYFPACDPSWSSIYTALDSLGIDASFEYREKIAIANGITDYTGSAEQNILMLALLKSGSLLNPEYVAPATTLPTPKEFTLVGNINGVDVGCEADHTSNPYIFDENGEITVTFDTMSYIYVKTTDQASWYMFSSYTTESTGTLRLSSNSVMEKMGVPAGTHKFKLVENSDGSLTISYETLSTPATTPTTPTATVECKEFYLVTNSTWTQDGARFAVYFYNYSGESIWVNLVATTDENVYKTAMPDGDWSHIICARMNPAYMENAFNTGTVTDRVWNQTSEMTLDKSLNTLTLGTSEFAGEWSYTQETVTDPTTEPTESATETTVATLAKRYSLVGYINGEDAGIESDNVNNPYKFDKKGSLVMTITEDSYVMVKTTNNEEWYGFEKYCTATKGTLVLKGPEKMYVPAGSYVFTLKENGDDTLTLSYTTVAIIPTGSDSTEPTDSDALAKLVVKKSVKAGKTITAKVENAGDNKVTYKTSDKKIVKVNKKTGKITALKKGTATIIAKVGDVTLTKKINVTGNPKVQSGKSTLSNNAKITVAKGKKITLVITGKAASINNKVVLQNKNIGKITSKANQDKIVIKTKKAGTSKLTVKINKSMKYTFTIKVK